MNELINKTLGLMHMDWDKQWGILKMELVKCHLHISSLKDDHVFSQSLTENVAAGRRGSISHQIMFGREAGRSNCN